MPKTIFFKRQSDIINKLFKEGIISNNSEIIIPSYICSEVINNFENRNINLKFYERDSSNEQILSLISEIELEKSKEIFLYFYFYYSNFKNLSEIISQIENSKVNIILDIAHLVNLKINNHPNIIQSYDFKKTILIASPRKYFRLSQGGFCKVNNHYLKIENKNFNSLTLLIDLIKNSNNIRNLISNYGLFSKKNTKVSEINYYDNQQTRSASIGHQIFYKINDLLNNDRHKLFFKKYLNLFKKYINQRDNNLDNELVFWIIPLDKDKKEIIKLINYFKFRINNPFMNWPDYHDKLSHKDKLFYEKNIYFRIDKNTCNNKMYKKIFSIIK